MIFLNPIDLLQLEANNDDPVDAIGKNSTDSHFLPHYSFWHCADCFGTNRAGQAERGQRAFVELRALDESVLELSMLQKGIEYDVLETQEKFEDAAATRGLDGLDQGLALAEAASKRLVQKIAQAKAVSGKLGLREMSGSLDALQTKYISFYKYGHAMAQVYMSEGTQSGNKLMAEFDHIAELLQSEIQATDAFVERVTKNTSDKFQADQREIANNQSTVSWIVNGLTVLAMLGGISRW